VIETIPKFDYQKLFSINNFDSFWANGRTGSEKIPIHTLYLISLITDFNVILIKQLELLVRDTPSLFPPVTRSKRSLVQFHCFVF
jgi:hypothetical protein